MKIDALGKDKPADAWEIYDNYRRSLMDRRDPGGIEGLSAGGTQESQDTKRLNNAKECSTCENRTYQDGSNDAGVSFKTATKIAPSQVASAVRGHEQEHVSREQGKAKREGRQVVSQSVTYHNAICPECGKVYISGGTTRTTTRGNHTPEPPQKGDKMIDTYA